jgi:archaemetzincin
MSEPAPAAARGLASGGPEALQLVPFFLGAHGGLLAGLQEGLGRAFGLQVAERPPGFDPELAYDASRGQYNSRLLLALLLRDLRPGSHRILGVTAVDLFIPVLTFVFGEAQLGGHAAVISCHRLDNEPYGLPPDPQLLRERTVKEALHEVGHNFGLIHCHRRCVMASSTYVEEIDLKPARFCEVCRRGIDAHPGVEATRAAR